MKPVIEVISPSEMAKLYWKRMRWGASREISTKLSRQENRLGDSGQMYWALSPVGRKYWTQVLQLLRMQESAQKKKGDFAKEAH